MFSIIAFAIRYTSSSEPVFFMAFTAHKMNRQFDCVYPLFGSIRSMLGESIVGPARFFVEVSKGIFVIAQCPLKFSLHHSFVRSHDLCAFLERVLAPIKRECHG